MHSWARQLPATVIFAVNSDRFYIVLVSSISYKEKYRIETTHPIHIVITVKYVTNINLSAIPIITNTVQQEKTLATKK